MSLHGGTEINKAIDNAFKAGYEEGLKDSELLRLLKDSTDALKWYLDNSTSEYSEPFFNIGMNQITENEELINKLEYENNT